MTASFTVLDHPLAGDLLTRLRDRDTGPAEYRALTRRLGLLLVTEATRDLATLLLPDSGRLQEEDARQAKKYGYSKHKPALPLFTEDDAQRALTQVQPVGFDRALLLESLGQAVRTAAFVVPGALGVQEGGYLVLGTVLGLTPETSLALSLAKRVREVALGVPGLIAWQAEAVTSLFRSGRGGRT